MKTLLRIFTFLFFAVGYAQISNGDFEQTFTDTLFFLPGGYSYGNFFTSAPLTYPTEKYGNVRPYKTGNNTKAELKTLRASQPAPELTLKIQGNYLPATYVCSVKITTNNPYSTDTFSVASGFAQGDSILALEDLELPLGKDTSVTMVLTLPATANRFYFHVGGGDSVGYSVFADSLRLQNITMGTNLPIPNPDFEQWTPYTQVKPQNWDFFIPQFTFIWDTLLAPPNFNTGFPVPFLASLNPTAEMTSDAFTGNNAVRLIPRTFQEETMKNRFSIITYGNLSRDFFPPEFLPYSASNAPDSLLFYYKTQNQNPATDSNFVAVYLKTGNTVSTFSSLLPASVSYTLHSVDLTSHNSLPDSFAVVFFTKADTNGTQPVFLYLDKVEFLANPVNISSYIQAKTPVYQNADFLYIASEQVPFKVEIFTLTGQKIKEKYSTNKEIALPKTFPKGIYAYRILNPNKEVIRQGKIWLY